MGLASDRVEGAVVSLLKTSFYAVKSFWPKKKSKESGTQQKTEVV